MTGKRYSPDDPAIQGREVVLAIGLDSIELDLAKAREEIQALSTESQQQAKLISELKAELAAVRNQSIALDSDASLDARMQAAGMFSVTQILAGKPIDAFIRHAGVSDLRTFDQWLGMKRAEFVKLQARFELAKREDDELYEWVMSHAATFSEVMINFKSAYRQEPGPTAEDHSEEPQGRSVRH